MLLMATATPTPGPTDTPTPLPTVTVTPEPTPAPSGPTVEEHLAHISSTVDTIELVAIAVGLTVVFAVVVIMVRALR